MDKIIVRLAEHTAIYLESICQGNRSEIRDKTTRSYFSKFKINTDSYAEQLPAGTQSVQGLYMEINSNLNYFGKVNLLLLVQDCLLGKHELPDFNKSLLGLFEAIGVDTSLMKRFHGFLKQDNPLTVDTNEYLLLSPKDSMDNEMLEGRWIEDNVLHTRKTSGKIPVNQFQNHLLVMFVEPIKSYVVRCLDNNDQLFDQDLTGYCGFILLRPGSELCINGIPVLTFSDLKSRFLQTIEKRELILSLDNIQYGNIKGTREIHSFSARETTGQLIGLVGREGVGKSTLLKLLAGKIKPDSGNIFINGYDLWRYKYLLKGVIGFVPEEDLLFEELSVEDNLSLTARLYYSHLSKKEIDLKVNTLLSRIYLLELKHVVVGSINSKHLQPGQRRLINIALELLREPQILLVDNALSGLGMSDACKVIKVLHDYSFEGNLVITSISQADSDTFLLFDKIWILDEGGYPVYNGSVKGAPGYILKSLKLSYQDKGKTDPAQLLDWVNYRLPDKDTHVWKRVMDPSGWHNQLMRNQVLQPDNTVTRNILPARILKIPNLEVQLLIFSIRNFKCKFSRVHEIFKVLLVGPLVAFLVSFILRSGNEGTYSLLTNPNIPVYQFISVVIAILLGLIASIDEINQEQNILEKEEYQEFSRFSYLNSKILYLFPVIAIQIVLYIITGNLILGIKEMFGVYWLVLFSSACFGALLGLVLSSGIQSMNLLHKAVLPFIIAIQLLLGGGIISYERLNLGSHKYTPLAGDLMVSRWGFEALAVEQFKNNSYEKNIYNIEKRLDQASFYAFYAIPKLGQVISEISNDPDNDSVNLKISLLQHEMKQVAKIPDVFRFEYLNNLSEINKNEVIRQEATDYITYLGIHFNEQQLLLSDLAGHILDSLSNSAGYNHLVAMKEAFHNQALEDVVTNNNGRSGFQIIDNEIVRKSGIIYTDPESEWGRACLFSPKKRFNGQLTNTIWFNISMIWLLTSFCYIWVLFDITSLIRSALKMNKVH